MTTINDRESGPMSEEMAQACEILSSENAPVAAEHAEAVRTDAPLPWIGALRNPRLGPMVVLDDKGALVPLWTASDLLRGCRYFWRGSRD